MPSSAELQQHAIEIWQAGVAAVHGQRLVEKAIRCDGDRIEIAGQVIDRSQFDRILIVGGGKFSHYMAKGVETALGEELASQFQLSGMVNVPDGSNEQVTLEQVEAIECRPAGVNLPTPKVIESTQRMIELLENCDDRTLVLALISGGGSALIEQSSLPLADVVAATQWLSLRGADIIELNTMRIAMSMVKGGGLARAMSSGTMIGLIVSDVPGDDIRFVSSGPTVEFEGDIFAAAQAVVAKFALAESGQFPGSVLEFLSADQPARAKCHGRIVNALIGNSDLALSAASAKAEELGYEILPDALSEQTTCDMIAGAVSSWVAELASGPQCSISLGEPVVEPGEGAGQGGRNQHAILQTSQTMLELATENEFCFLSAGTDGEDGNTPVAGALLTRSMLQRLSLVGKTIEKHLAAFDSHPFLADHDMLFESGTTATNVADLRVLLRSQTQSVAVKSV